MPFFVSDYLSSAKVRQMSLPERGAYLELMMFQWQEKSLPKSVPRLARLLGESTEAFTPIWETIKGQFVEDGSGGLINERVEAVRNKTLEVIERKREGGRVSGRVRKQSSKTPAKSPRTTRSISKNPYSPLFRSLWDRCPLKVGRKGAMRHFGASVKTDRDAADIEQALENYLAHLNRNPAKPPQNGSTWFNNWRDWVDFEEPAQRTPTEPRRHGSFVV